MPKIFALIDCNSFYCSCEQVFKPHLRGKPIVVLSNNDGCAISRTPEAKALGVKMGEPAFKIKNNPAFRDVIMVSSNYTLYGDLSYRVQQVVREFIPHLEIYSIDEMFLNFEGFEQIGLVSHAQAIREAVHQWVGIPTCVGIGSTKTLSKIANAIAKKTPQANGVISLMDDETCNAYLDSFPVEDVWGVGRATAVKLKALGINTAKQLKDMPVKQARKYGGIIAERMICELRGISCLELDELPLSPKGTAVTRSFGKPVTSYEDMSQAIANYCARGAEKLRSNDMIAGKLTVFMHTSRYRKTEQYYNTAQATLSPMTNDTRSITKEALRLTKQIYKQGIEFGKAGIYLDNLKPESERPLDLFSVEQPNSKELMKTIDALNKRFGKKSVQFAGMGTQHKWTPISKNKSKCYTTRIDEVAKVRAI